MPKITLDDLRKEYQNLTGKKAAVNWNKQTIQKKMKLYQAEKAIDSEISKKPADTVTQTVNPAFEAAIDNEPADVIPDEPVETRGGFREGAGRPIGQTDKRARCEQLMKRDVPDIAIQQLLVGLNLGLFVKTGVPFTEAQIDKIALGITLPLYYWFPSLEGRTDAITLHLTSLQMIGSAVKEHVFEVKNYQKQKEQEEKQNQKNDTPVVVTPENPSPSIKDTIINNSVSVI